MVPEAPAPVASWLREDTARQEGERYERDVVRRALALFSGGQGGSPGDAQVRERLAVQRQARLDEGLLPAEEDPLLADLIWWKGEQVAVVEASVQVNGTDVARAAARAATLGAVRSTGGGGRRRGAVGDCRRHPARRDLAGGVEGRA